jgi:hypothetical protein
MFFKCATCGISGGEDQMTEHFKTCGPDSEISKLRAEKDALVLQIDELNNRLKQIAESEDTTRMTGEQIMMGYNAHKDLARAALSESQYPQKPFGEPLCGCGCHGSNWGQATACGCCAYPTMRPEEMKEAKKRIYEPLKCECGMPVGIPHTCEKRVT